MQSEDYYLDIIKKNKKRIKFLKYKLRKTRQQVLNLKNKLNNKND